MAKKVKLQVWEGVEGVCVILNDYRIIGNKLWGGVGRLLKEKEDCIDDLSKALNGSGYKIIKAPKR